MTWLITRYLPFSSAFSPSSASSSFVHLPICPVAYAFSSTRCHPWHFLSLSHPCCGLSLSCSCAANQVSCSFQGTPPKSKKQVHVICSPYTTNPLRRQVPVNLHPGPVDPMRPFCHSMILFTVPVDSPRPPPESPLICPAAAVFNNPASTATAMQMQNIPLSCEKHLLFS
jgi:hypothetical protein